MNKHIIMILSLCFIISLFSIGFTAYATEPDLLFEMDLSDSTSENLVVKASSASTGTESVSATYTKDGNEYSPDYKEEDGLKYLSFRSSKQDTANQASRVTVQLTDTGILNKNSLTFETWARSKDITNAGDNRFFGLGFEAQNKMGHYVRLDMARAVTITDNPGGGTNYVALGSLTDTDWHHYAFVYSFTPTVESAPFGAGTWSVTMYIDGESKGTKNKSVDARGNYVYGSTAGGTQVATHETHIYNDLIIGDSDGKAWVGDIATFKMYDGVLDATTILNSYSTERGTYMEVPDVSRHSLSEISRSEEDFSITFDMAVDGESVTSDAVYIEDSLGRKLTVVKKSYDESTFTAAYTLNNYLDYNQTYYLCLPGITDKEGGPIKRSRIEFVTKEREGIVASPAVVTDSSGESITDLSNTDVVNIKVNIENKVAGTQKTCAMALVIYDEKGYIVEMVRSADVVIEGEQSGFVEVSTQGIELPTGCKIKAIAWSDEPTKDSVAISMPVELQ